jgi:hypothetical protein
MLAPNIIIVSGQSSPSEIVFADEIKIIETDYPQKSSTNVTAETQRDNTSSSLTQNSSSIGVTSKNKKNSRGTQKRRKRKVGRK